MTAEVKDRPTYDDDFYAWTQDQAKHLQALATTDQSPDLDWLQLADEIESAGRAELHECQDSVELIITNLLQLQFAPEVDQRWRIETAIVEARIAFEQRTTPTISRLIEASLAEHYAEACRILRAGSETIELPATCPYTFDQILSPDDWLPKSRGLLRKAEIIRRLVEHEDEIRAFKAESLYLYGSTARDEATPTSDIDVFIDPAPGFTFVELVGLQDRLGKILGGKADLTTRAGLHPTLRQRIEASAERIL